MKRLLIPTVAITLLLVLGLVGAEVLAQGYAYFIAEKGKRFQPDTRLGWIPIPNLDVVRRNANGDIYRIQTDETSIRGPSVFPESQNIRRVLVIGDSFAFGEGVNLENRFDVLLAKRIPGTAFVNMGVPGYGTDQELLRAQDALPLLRNNDVSLILLYGNDFHDVARTRHSGRSKPWYGLSGEKLIRHDPEIGNAEWMRDKSYLFSVFASKFQYDTQYERRLSQSLDIVGLLLKTFAADVSVRGARVWIAYHGLEAFGLPFDRATIANVICRYADRCIDLDPVLSEPRFFLKDGHWSEDGHQAVASYLGGQLFPAGGAVALR